MANRDIPDKDKDRDNDDYKHDARLEQYKRFSEDWRHFSSLTWQIPSVAIAVLGGLIAAVKIVSSNSFYSAIMFGAGSAFIMCLAIVSAKYRFFHVARSNFLLDLEEQFRVTKFEVKTSKTLDYFERKNESLDPQEREKHPPKILLHGSAADILIWIILGIGIPSNNERIILISEP